jgi:hypothetical protein
MPKSEMKSAAPITADLPTSLIAKIARVQPGQTPGSASELSAS